jgi:hypothetical protein
MERLFSPCIRLQDILESQGRLEEFRGDPSEILEELNLNVSTEELLSAERALAYADLHAMLGNQSTIAWLTPHAGIALEDGRARRYLEQLDESCHFRFAVDGKEDNIVVFARSSEHLLEICDVVFRLLAVSVVQSLHLTDQTPITDLFINAPTLAYLMEQCQSLKVLSLKNLEMDEDHCRVLGAYSRPGLEIELINCQLTRAGAGALAEVLGRNQGPTKLISCYIDNVVLANGLRGNSRMKVFKARLSCNLVLGNREVLEYTHALSENRGLVYLKIESFLMSDETWGAVCHSLKTHPTLQVLDLHTSTFEPSVHSAAITPRISALLGMLKVNTVIHTIHLHSRYSEHELFQDSVTPYLETNRLRPRVREIQKTLATAYRARVLGRALLAVRTDSNRFWMLLSGNAEVAFPSSTTTATTTPAANLPAPATVGASANAAIGAANPVATSSPTANVAAAASGQKRKACPESQPGIAD